jgi:hypothetical protein
MNTYNFDAGKALQKATDMMNNKELVVNEDPKIRAIVNVAWDLSRDTEHFLNNFIKTCRDVAERTERLAAQLEQNGIDASVNSLGELQQQSLYVDLMCARFAEIKNQLAMFDKLTK